MTKWVDFKEVKAQADFSQVLMHYGLSGEVKGDEVRILCPFHEDTKPSCAVSLSKKAYHCWSCEAKGNVLDFVVAMEGEGTSLRSGALKLSEINGTAVEDRQAAKRETKRAEKPTEAEEEGDLETDHSHTQEPESPDLTDQSLPGINPVLDFALKLKPTHGYFTQRGITRRAIETFGLGFANRGMMKNRICFPLHNEVGELIGYCGRWADDRVPEGTSRYKFPPKFLKSLMLYNFHRVFSPEEVAAEEPVRPVVLVEGFWSAIRLHLAGEVKAGQRPLGVPTVATMGTDLCEDQILLLKKVATKVIVVMDGDEAGERARADMVKNLSEHIPTQSLVLSEGMKPDVMPEPFLVRLVELVGSPYAINGEGRLASVG